MEDKIDPWPEPPDKDSAYNQNAVLWEAFCDFEACLRDSKNETFASFFTRWETRLEKMEVLGIMYPDQLLVMKLSYACRLDFNTVNSLLNALQSSDQQQDNGRSCEEKLWARAKEILCEIKLEEEENMTQTVVLTELKADLCKPETQSLAANSCQEQLETQEEDSKVLYNIEVLFDPDDQDVGNDDDDLYEPSSGEDEERGSKSFASDKFVCRPCAKSFTSQEALDKHRLNHKPRECDKCGKLQVSQYAYSRHMRISKCAEKLECELCGKRFNPSSMKKHMKLHETKQLAETKECPDESCDMVFYNNLQLKKHIKEVHKTEKMKNFTCDICNESFTCELFLTNHHKAKHEVLFCESCGKSGEGLPRLAMQHHITYCAKAFHCNLCHKAFKTKESYEKHTANHTEHTCTKCNKVFPSKKRYAVHLKQSSCAEKVMCKFCGEYFNPGGIRRHEGKHKSDQSFQCPREGCDQSYWNKLELDRHLLKHDGIRNFHCDQCESKFVTQLQLKRHIQTIHLRTQSRDCDICGRSFQNKSKLKVHYRSHTGEKPFKCDFCDKAFSKKERCKIHIDRVHKGIKTEKPTRCELCQKEFTKRWNWSQHMKKVHKMESYRMDTVHTIPDLVKVEKAN